jgi:hypothetical protein
VHIKEINQEQLGDVYGFLAEAAERNRRRFAKAKKAFNAVKESRMNYRNVQIKE